MVGLPNVWDSPLIGIGHECNKSIDVRCSGCPLVSTQIVADWELARSHPWRTHEELNVTFTLSPSVVQPHLAAAYNPRTSGCELRFERPCPVGG